MGWTSLPPTSNSAHFAGNTRSGRWTRRGGSRAGRERIAVFADSYLLLEEAPPVVHRLVEQRPDHSAVPSGMVGHFLKPQFRAQHERLGFLTARNHVRRPLGLALVDQPMAQLHGCASHFRISEATQFSISPAPANSSGASKKAENGLMQVVHFGQPKTRAPSPTEPPLSIEMKREIRNCHSILRNETMK